MAKARLGLLLAFALNLAGCGDSPKPAPLIAVAPTPDERIEQLIARLGSESFTEREEASKALEEIGAAALPRLRKATAHTDAEITYRSGKLVAVIEQRVEAEKLLEPTRLHLTYKDTPVLAAIVSCRKRHAVPLNLTGTVLISRGGPCHSIREIPLFGSASIVSARGQVLLTVRRSPPRPPSRRG